MMMMMMIMIGYSLSLAKKRINLQTVYGTSPHQALNSLSYKERTLVQTWLTIQLSLQ